MKTVIKIALLLLVVGFLFAACASSGHANRKGQIPCPAYGNAASGYERQPY